MVAAADQAEIDQWFSTSSISDQELLQAVENIESALISTDNPEQTGEAPEDATVTVESIGIAGNVEPLQRGKFYTDCTFTICILAFSADIGRKPASPARES